MAGGSFAEGLVGIVLDGRYRLDALLGEGGMGAVFRATHVAMNRRIAIKLLKPHLTADETALARFEREARTTMRVDSPHAVKVLDFGITPHSDYYIAMEYLDGRSVQRELDVDGPFAPARVVHIARQALEALGAAHREGLIHRDVKPENLLLLRAGDDPDFTKVVDFGVAKLMEGAARSAKSALALTQAGMVFGTPEFMSPEQACGQPLDGRSDLYALAATMFAMLTGCALFTGASPIEWLTHHVRTPPPHLADGKPELAAYPELDELLQCCLAKSPAARPARAEEMSRRLAAVEPTLARPPGEPRPAPGRRMRSASASPSSYMAALPSDATLLPGAVVAPISVGAPTVRAESPALAAIAPETGVTDLLAAARGRRRGWLVLSGLALVGAVVAVAVALAARGRPSAASPAPAPAPTPPLRIAAVAIDAGARRPDTAPAPPPPDAAPIAAPSPGARPSPHVHADRHVDPRVRAEVAKHVAAAERAQAAGNRLLQLAESDAALHLEPGNVRARLLAADALLQDHDLENGCRYLRMISHNATARARAHQAGCPGD